MYGKTVKKPKLGMALMKKAAAAEDARDRQARVLPPWTHPEWGEYVPEIQDTLDTDSDVLYYTKLEALSDRKWSARFPFVPLPGIRYCLMWPPGESGSWGGVSMICVDASDLDPGRREAFAQEIQKTKTDAIVKGQYVYISPFFEWGLADYWEEGWYDK